MPLTIRELIRRLREMEMVAEAGGMAYVYVTGPPTDARDVLSVEKVELDGEGDVVIHTKHQE
jgi:hypothetical protein